MSGTRDQVDIVQPAFVEMAVQTDEAELRDMATQTDGTVVTVLTMEDSTQTVFPSKKTNMVDSSECASVLTQDANSIQLDAAPEKQRLLSVKVTVMKRFFHWCKSTKEYLKMLQVLINILLHYKIICILLGANVVAYYDSVSPWNVSSSCKRCEFCKKFHDNNLHTLHKNISVHLILLQALKYSLEGREA